MSKVRISYEHLNNQTIESQGRQASDRLGGNENFPAAQEYLPELDKLLDNQREFNSKAPLGNKDDIHARRDNKALLTSLMNKIARVVNATTDELSILETSGLPLVKKSSPVGPLPKPIDFYIESGLNPGDVSIQCKANRDAKFYQFYYSEGEPKENIADWQSHGSTTRKTVISGLKMGAKYYFKCAYKGASSVITYSDVLSRFIS